MAFCSFTKESSSSSTTTVSNNFILNYLTDANGDAVKVYLYGLYLCQNSHDQTDIIEFAKDLYMDENEVKDYFSFWEEYGLVSIISLEPFTVKYLSPTSNAKLRKFKPEKYSDFTKALQALISDRMIQPNEFSEYFSLMEDNNVKPDALLMIIKYCVELKGANIGYRYILTVCRDFISRNVTTTKLIEQELDEYFHRTDDIQLVLSALGTKRKPEIEDLQLLNKWRMEMGFDVETIVYSAKKSKSKSMDKLDGFILELYNNRCFGKKEIDGYLSEKETITQTAISVSRGLAVYCEILQPYIENYISPWMAKGFSPDALNFIANVCFKRKKRSFEEMDETIAFLYNQGIISIESIAIYFENVAKDDDFIKQLLIIAKSERRPNKFDREALKLWHEWGFSDEMIKKAAELSQGKTSPISYINVILSNWKTNKIFKVEDVPIQITTQSKQQAPTFGCERTFTQDDFNKIIDNIEDIDI